MCYEWTSDVARTYGTNYSLTAGRTRWQSIWAVYMALSWLLSMRVQEPYCEGSHIWPTERSIHSNIYVYINVSIYIYITLSTWWPNRKNLLPAYIYIYIYIYMLIRQKWMTLSGSSDIISFIQVRQYSTWTHPYGKKNFLKKTIKRK